MDKWISTTDKPIPYDYDVIICHWASWPYEKPTVCLARAWATKTSSGRIIPRSFICWPDRTLIPYSRISHWMLAPSLPEPRIAEPAPPAGDGQTERSDP